MMKKGITPVVTMILLLLIAVVVVGLAFVFFTRTISDVSNTAGAQIDTTTGQMAKAISIDNVASTTVTVRNIGSAAVSVSELTVYVNNVVVSTCGWTGSINPGATKGCTIACGATGQSVKVTGPANDDTESCP